jgi:hypothetical protein
MVKRNHLIQVDLRFLASTDQEEAMGNEGWLPTGQIAQVVNKLSRYIPIGHSMLQTEVMCQRQGAEAMVVTITNQRLRSEDVSVPRGHVSHELIVPLRYFPTEQKILVQEPIKIKLTKHGDKLKGREATAPLS